MSDLLNNKEVNDMSTLSVQQQGKINDISSKMNIRNVQSVIEFGKEAQVKLLHFSNKLSEEIHNSDTMNVGQILSHLLTKVNQFDVDDVLGKKKGLFSKFLPPKRPSQKLISKYQKMGIEVDYISTRLEKEGKILEKEIDMLEKMYEANKEYFIEISMYVDAGKYKMNEIKINVIPSLQEKLVNANPIEKEELHDVERYLNLLDKRIYNLELSQQISIQKAPQIRMIQENHRMLLDKIQSSILNTIPLWKDQFILGLTLERQSQALNMQRKVTESTNDLLVKSADFISKNSVEVTREHAKSMFDIENLRHSMSQLIGTIDEVKHLQESSRVQQHSIEQELLKMDQELKISIDKN